MKKIRVIIYESDDEEWIEKTLEKSLPVGITHITNDKTITVLTEKQIGEDETLKEFVRERLYSGGNSMLFRKIDSE